MSDVVVDTWLYGTLARYGGDASEGSYAHLEVRLPEGSTMSDLLAHAGLPTEERGVTFVNGQLSAMPGLQPDLADVLRDGDRVGLFDLTSMWPCQYRHGAAMTEALAAAVAEDQSGGLHHSYRDA